LEITLYIEKIGEKFSADLYLFLFIYLLFWRSHYAFGKIIKKKKNVEQLGKFFAPFPKLLCSPMAMVLSSGVARNS